MAPLPVVIDAACMRNGTQDECNAFGTKLLDGMVEQGFEKLVNHSVPLPVVEDAFTMVSHIRRTPYPYANKDKRRGRSFSCP